MFAAVMIWLMFGLADNKLLFSVTFQENQIVCQQCSATLESDDNQFIPKIEQVQSDAYAVRIEGAADAFSRVQIFANDASGGPTNEFSMAAWVKFDRVSFHRDSRILEQRGVDNKIFPHLSVVETDQFSSGEFATVRARFGFGSGAFGVETIDVLDRQYMLFPDRWTFVVMRKSISEVQLFRDLDEQVKMQLVNNQQQILWGNASQPWAIGTPVPNNDRSTSDVRGMTGWVAAVHVFDHSLSDIEMRRLYARYRWDDSSNDTALQAIRAPSLVSVPNNFRNYFAAPAKGATLQIDFTGALCNLQDAELFIVGAKSLNDFVAVPDVEIQYALGPVVLCVQLETLPSEVGVGRAVSVRVTAKNGANIDLIARSRRYRIANEEDPMGTTSLHTVDDVFNGTVRFAVQLFQHSARPSTPVEIGKFEVRAMPGADLFEKVEDNYADFALPAAPYIITAAPTSFVQSLATTSGGVSLSTSTSGSTTTLTIGSLSSSTTNNANNNTDSFVSSIMNNDTMHTNNTNNTNTAQRQSQPTNSNYLAIIIIASIVAVGVLIVLCVAGRVWWRRRSSSKTANDDKEDDNTSTAAVGGRGSNEYGSVSLASLSTQSQDTYTVGDIYDVL